MVIRNIASGTIQKLFNTFFSNAIMLNSCGGCTLEVWVISPISIDYLFVNWSKSGGTTQNSLLFTATSVLCWTIWLIRNKVVFDKCRPKTFFAGAIQGNPLATSMGRTAAA
jgi:hypothetical protein